MNRYPAILILTLLSGSPVFSLADTLDSTQSHQTILDTARNFLETLPEIQQHPDALIDLGHIDTRLQLQNCADPLQAFLAPGSQVNSGKATIGIRCVAPKPWALYVPATITLYATVYQASKPLPREHLIHEEDIEAAKIDLNRLTRGYYTDKSSLLGKTTRQNIRQGQVFNPGLVKSSIWIKRGERVELVAQTDTFAIRMLGEAITNGNEGEQVRVKNLSSGRIVDGIVTERGVVRVMN